MFNNFYACESEDASVSEGVSEKAISEWHEVVIQ